MSMDMMSYDSLIKDIRASIAGVEKTASEKHVTESDVLEGDPRKLAGPGKKVNKNKEKNEAVSGTAQPLQEDDSSGASNYTLDNEKTHECVTDKHMKASKIGDNVIQRVYDMLYKGAQDEEDMEEEVAEEVAEEPESDDYEEEMEDEIEIPEDIITEEEKEELKTKSASYRKKYIAKKISGFKTAKMIEESGVLDKMAMAMAVPMAEELASFQLGRTIASLEKQGMCILPQEELIKSGQFIAGGIVAQMEKQGILQYNEEEAETKTKTTVKQASDKKAQNYLLVKEAAQKTTENVLNDIRNIDDGQNINQKLAKLVNPR